MKLSNNALNFLLAQYRAIFKRAYVKGIASAVLLTAGLAAGSAQAEDITSGGSSWATAPSITVTENSNYKVTSTDRYFDNITITSGTLTFDSGTGLLLKGTLNVGQGTTLKVETSNHAIDIGGWDAYDENVGSDQATGKLVSEGTISIKASNASTYSMLQLSEVTLKSGSVTSSMAAMATQRVQACTLKKAQKLP